MLTIKNAMRYEFSATSGVTLFLFLIQLLTGPMFTWLLWVWSFATVTLGFIDNTVVGWKLTSEVQSRRTVFNLLAFMASGIILYAIAFFLIPDIDVTKIMSVINGLQKLMKIYTYMGPFLHIIVYNLMHFCVINFIRIFVNLAYTVYLVVDTVVNPE